MALRPQQAQKRHRRRQLQQELLNGGEAGVAVMLYLLIVINIADDAEYQGKQVYIDMGKVPLHHALPAHNHHRDADADDEHQPAHSGGTLLGHVPGGANLLDALSGLELHQLRDQKLPGHSRDGKADSSCSSFRPHGASFVVYL